MISLQELINTYQPFGIDDYQIIKMFFTKNKIEEQAIKMLTELSQEKIKDLHYTNSLQKEYIEYCSAILYNEVKIEIKLELFNYCKKFLLYEDLNENELKKCKEIFDNNKIVICPYIFYNYLATQGVVDKMLNDMEINEIKSFTERRNRNK